MKRLLTILVLAAWLLGDVAVAQLGANGLNTATTTVVTSGATAPTSGQVLTATGPSAANWQTPSAGGTVTWPANTDLVISNGTNSPAGLAPVNGNCVVGSGGAWVAGSCPGSSFASPTITGTATLPDSSTWSSTGILGLTSVVAGSATASSPLLTVINPKVQTLGTGSGATAVSNMLGAWNTSLTGESIFFFVKSHSGTVGPLNAGAIQNNEVMGKIQFVGDDGSTAGGIEGAEILGSADGNWSSGSTPGKLIFSTTAIGSSTSTHRLQIDHSGIITVNNGATTVVDQSGNLYGQGTQGVSCAANTVNLTTFTVVGGVVTHC